MANTPAEVDALQELKGIRARIIAEERFAALIAELRDSEPNQESFDMRIQNAFDTVHADVAELLNRPSLPQGARRVVEQLQTTLIGTKAVADYLIRELWRVLEEDVDDDLRRAAEIYEDELNDSQ